MSDQEFMQIACQLALDAVKIKIGGPFGAIIVKDGKIVGRGQNRVTSSMDVTAHAEIMAIRDACKNLDTFQLDGCTMYTSCEPCPMCLGAIYWARLDKVYYGLSRHDAAEKQFDDKFIYDEAAKSPEARQIKFEKLACEDAKLAFETWHKMEDKTRY